MNSLKHVSFLAILLVLVIGFWATVSLDCSSNNRTATRTSFSSQAPNMANQPVSSQSTQLSSNVSDTGQQVKNISLNQGAVVFRIEVRFSNTPEPGNRHFSVWLKNSSGGNEELLVNETLTSPTTSFSCVKQAPYAGQYYLDVDCSPRGSWTIEWS